MDVGMNQPGKEQAASAAHARSPLARLASRARTTVQISVAAVRALDHNSHVRDIQPGLSFDASVPVEAARQTSSSVASSLPVRVVDIEIEQPLPTLFSRDECSGAEYQRAHCLIRLHTRPLGIVDMAFDGEQISPEQSARRIWDDLGAEILEHLQQDDLRPIDGLSPGGLMAQGMPRCIAEREEFLQHAPYASIIVCTRDRPDFIAACLRSVLSQRYPRYEVVVVDNAPSTSATAEYISETYAGVPHVRYVREDRPGLASARNCGAMAATGEILAFTDDDVKLDRYWLAELVQGFTQGSRVVCATGPVLPLELQTQAQLWFEEFGGYVHSFTPKIYSSQSNPDGAPLFPYTAGRFGTGANVAMRATFFRAIGGFDPALGTGTPARSGEDLAAFVQAITRGYAIAYQPAALLFHPSHREYPKLRSQITGYGVGIGAYLTKLAINDPQIALDLIAKVPRGLYFVLSSRSSKNQRRSASYPKELVTNELKGMAQGPFLYMWSRWHAWMAEHSKIRRAHDANTRLSSAACIRRTSARRRREADGGS